MREGFGVPGTGSGPMVAWVIAALARVPWSLRATMTDAASGTRVLAHRSWRVPDGSVGLATPDAQVHALASVGTWSGRASSQPRRDGEESMRKIAATLLALTVLASACGGGDEARDPAPTPTAGDGSSDSTAAGTAVGTTARLGVRLSEGAAAAQAVTAAVARVQGTPLPADRVEAILAALPPLPADPEDVTDFNRPPNRLPPPRAGEIVEVPFPAPVAAEAPGVASGPLQVIRYQPEGAVDLAPFFTVTFDQPMVAVATLEALDAGAVPVSVTPPVEGRWRWLGTRTLRFEVDPAGGVDRLAGATTYRVEVPAGTTSATGGVLAEAVSWEFTTAPVAVELLTTPREQTLGLEPIVVVSANQIVDPAAALSRVAMTAAGDAVALRLATPDEVAADETAAQITSAFLDGRWFAVRPVDPLPLDAEVVITAGPEIPSAEGPNLGDGTTQITRRTYGPFEVRAVRCDSPCTPYGYASIELSNPVDPATFDPAAVVVDPPVGGRRVQLYGSTIAIEGAMAGRTTYTVTLPDGIRDQFGQALVVDRELTFTTGRAEPALFGFERPFVTVDPLADRPVLTFATINHADVRVRVWAVEADDLGRAGPLFRDDRAREPGDWAELLVDETVTIAAEDDQLVETAYDLSDYYANHDGPLLVRVEPTTRYPRDSNRWYQNRPSTAWVQRTTIGLDAFADNDELVVWTTDLRTGEPLEGVTVTGGELPELVTDAAGLARTELPATAVQALVARRGDDTAVLPAESWYYEGISGWSRFERADGESWYGMTDRGIYRPGETVHVKGWVRAVSGATALPALIASAGPARYLAYDAFGTEVATGETELSPIGGFDLTFTVPEAANLGGGWIEVWLDRNRGSAYVPFQIQEFRTPEFEVVARNESPGPYVKTAPATVAVAATYLAGGGLASAPVTWTVSTQQATYRPPGWDAFTFGIWQPWWLGYGRAAEFAGEALEYDCCFPVEEVQYEEFRGTTDVTGNHYLQLDFDGPDVDLPSTVSAAVVVEDVNRQQWADQTDLLVHAARLYVGLRSTRSFVEQGTPIEVEAVVTDIDGAGVADRALRVDAARVEWTLDNGEWIERLVDPQSCDLTSAADTAGTCRFTTAVGGEYRLTAVVADDDGGRNRTELTVWVSGGQDRPSRTVEQQVVDLIPNAPTYAPGDTAEVLVRSPLATGTGLLTITRNGLVRTETFAVQDHSAVLRIPIDQDATPNLNLQVEVVGTEPRRADDGSELTDAPPRPAFGAGFVTLPVPPVAKTLGVTVTPAADVLEPGADTSVAVVVSGPDGAPVEGAELAVVVVDEAVLGLIDYQLPNPLDTFYPLLYDDVYATYGRASIVLNRPEDLGTGGDVGAGGEGAVEAPAEEVTEEGGADLANSDTAGSSDEAFRPVADALPDGTAPVEPIDLRTNFDALALFAPEVRTDAGGAATVDLTLPDNLTRYRVMVVAAEGAERFGTGEANLTARLPLQVRPSAPRFLNFGDEFELPVVVQNQTDRPLDVEVAVDGSNVSYSQGAGQLVTVPANDRLEVRFPATVDSAGEATLRVAAVSGELRDAAAVELPVYTPATTEAFAAYGVVDDSAVLQPVTAPEGVFPQFGQLSVDTAATALQSLTDAVIYLDEYRYGSADAYASRIMAIAALRDVLGAFSAPGLPSRERLDGTVAADVSGLLRLQSTDNGGFWSWSRLQPQDPYVSVQATHALVLAVAAGYDVPPGRLELALGYIADIESHIPAAWGQVAKDSLSAYALNVRLLAGQRDSAKAAALYERAGEDLGLDGLAWIWPVLDDGAADAEIERIFVNGAVETAGAASFAVDYGEDAYLVLASDRRTDGIVLDALVQRAPESDLIPKVVTGLLAGRTKGRWDNVQENTFILLGLKRYFDTFESETPSFTAGIWLGDLYAGEHVYAGRSTDRGQTNIAMTELVDAGATALTIGKDGNGRLYYRIGLTYAPDDLRLDARDEGFVVDRVYEAVDDPADVTFVDGEWRIRAGATVRVRLTMVADSQRTHVALVDNLPAGLEAVNPALAVAPPPPVPSDDGGDGAVTPREECCVWWGPWFEHQNLGTDRVEAIASYLNGGTYEYTYLARATTPGRFIIPPARAEEIYAPEVFGRTASAVVVIAE